MAGATGHVGETQGGELCDKRSRRQFTLADALQPGVQAAQSESQGRQAAALQLVQVFTPLEWNAPGLLWPHRKVLASESLMLRSPKTDRHQHQRGK